MRTILKNRVTGLYYQGVADWSPRVDEAFDFQGPERLVRFVLAAHLDLENMELLFVFDDPQYNISLPIDQRFGVTASCARKRRTSQQPEVALLQPSRVTGGSHRLGATPRPALT